MPLIQVREKAQITIPSKIRKELGIKKGDYLEIAKEDDWENRDTSHFSLLGREKWDVSLFSRL